MNKTYKTALNLLLATSVLTVASGLAVADEGQFYIVPGIQRIAFDKDRVQGYENGFTLGAGYDFTNKLSAEINIFDMSLDGAPDDDIRHVRADLLYSFDSKMNKITPFIAGGVGHNRFSQNEETVFDVAAGVSYHISDKVQWRTAIRKYWGMDEHFHDYALETGLVFRFGGASKPATPAAAVAAAPAPAPAAAPLDSDGDGVPDSRDACPDTPRTHRVDSRGCSIALEEVARIDLTVQFDFDRSVVKPEYMAEIRALADFMKANTDVSAVLEGHTDSVGTEQYNQALSMRRVNAVRQVLIDQFGIAASRMRVEGFGESRPVTSNDTAEGRARNRRVQSVISTTLQRYEQR